MKKKIQCDKLACRTSTLCMYSSLNTQNKQFLCKNKRCIHKHRLYLVWYFITLYKPFIEKWSLWNEYHLKCIFDHHRRLSFFSNETILGALSVGFMQLSVRRQYEGCFLFYSRPLHHLMKVSRSNTWLFYIFVNYVLTQSLFSIFLFIIYEKKYVVK